MCHRAWDGQAAHRSTEKESTATPSVVENTDALPMLTPSSDSRAVMSPSDPRRSANTSQIVARPVSSAMAVQLKCTLVDACGSAISALTSRECCILSVKEVAME